MSRSLFRYLWVAPVTLPALGLVALGCATGGKARVVAGIIEATGGLISPVLRRGSPWVGSIAAITLGHVILGQNRACLEESRLHEHVHIRQYERWGALMPVLYLGASFWLWIRRRDPYRDNPFEVEAYADDEARRQQTEFEAS